MYPHSRYILSDHPKILKIFMHTSGYYIKFWEPLCLWKIALVLVYIIIDYYSTRINLLMPYSLQKGIILHDTMSNVRSYYSNTDKYYQEDIPRSIKIKTNIFTHLSYPIYTVHPNIFHLAIPTIDLNLFKLLLDIFAIYAAWTYMLIAGHIPRLYEWIRCKLWCNLYNMYTWLTSLYLTQS